MNPDDLTPDKLAAAEARAYERTRAFRELRDLIDPSGVDKCIEPWCDGEEINHEGADPANWMHKTPDLTLIPGEIIGRKPVTAGGAVSMIGDDRSTLTFVASCSTELVITDADHLRAVAATLHAAAEELGELATVLDLRGAELTEALTRHAAKRLHL